MNQKRLLPVLKHLGGSFFMDMTREREEEKREHAQIHSVAEGGTIVFRRRGALAGALIV